VRALPRLILLCAAAVAVPSVQAGTATQGQVQQWTHAPPVPPDGPLGDPRSMNQVGLPEQLTQDAIPGSNPITPEKVQLGRRLFFDERLSADGWVACATCHDPARAFTDGRAVSIGISGHQGQRNSPTILNAIYNRAQFWDGRAVTLEEQAGLPIVNPDEMGQPNLEAAVAAILGISEYIDAFQKVFGHPVNGPDMLRAIATYERSLVSFDSPFDHYIAGESTAISAAAQHGWELFNTKARCNKCHAVTEKKRDPTFFTDFDYHNIGILILRHHVRASAEEAEREIARGDLEAIDRAAIDSQFSVLGRFLVTRKSADIASFKTPNLRNVMVTAPYFHDGSQATLWDVMDHYNKGDGLKDKFLDEDIQPLALTEAEIEDVVEFMATLTSPQYAALGARELARQRALSKISRPQRDTQRAFGRKPPHPPSPPAAAQ
jgi:cytochrome c peroxidase